MIFGIYVYYIFGDQFSEKLIHKEGLSSITNIVSSKSLKSDTSLEEVDQEEKKVEVVDSTLEDRKVVKEEDIPVSNSVVDSINYTNIPNNNNSTIIGKEENIESPSLSEIDTVYQNTDILGTYGRLYIPSVDLNVGLYSVDMTSNVAQKIVDDYDSAAYFEFNNQNVIADHNHQGFHKIINIPISEKAYIKKADGSVDTYQLTQKFEGKNLEYDLVDLNDQSVFNNPNALIMYTCYKMSEYDNHIMITIFQLV